MANSYGHARAFEKGCQSSRWCREPFDRTVWIMDRRDEASAGSSGTGRMLSGRELFEKSG
jgi:hypothetical protein